MWKNRNINVLDQTKCVSLHLSSQNATSGKNNKKQKNTTDQ